MLALEEQPGANELEAINQLLDDLGDEIWGFEQLHTVLKSWIQSFPSSKPYDGTLLPQQEILSEPQVRFAPAIILRRRTERSFVRAFQEIIAQLEDPGNPIPSAVGDVVRDPSTSAVDYSSLQTDETESAENGAGEIFFPLPANEDQLKSLIGLRQEEVCSSRGRQERASLRLSRI